MLILNIVLKKIIICEHHNIPVFKAVSRWNDMQFVLGDSLLCDLSITPHFILFGFIMHFVLWPHIHQGRLSPTLNYNTMYIYF